MPMYLWKQWNTYFSRIISKKDSNHGYGDVIALVNSKSLSHYIDTKILELGTYSGKKD
ncbi:hypothetical protein [uncultured Methanobrevibacter sp.]|uniref:hypothetical protein n=1 Tax=uncultured Methanobrevibacter sp. TaxID=253161 RepID=UPI002584A92A|nr:hypothetical protein [uncultured Methanobrevibacter sp.]